MNLAYCYFPTIEHITAQVALPALSHSDTFRAEGRGPALHQLAASAAMYLCMPVLMSICGVQINTSREMRARGGPERYRYMTQVWSSPRRFWLAQHCFRLVW